MTVEACYFEIFIKNTELHSGISQKLVIPKIVCLKIVGACSRKCKGSVMSFQMMY
jgi:hypothetical protein